MAPLIFPLLYGIDDGSIIFVLYFLIILGGLVWALWERDPSTNRRNYE